LKITAFLTTDTHTTSPTSNHRHLQPCFP